MIQSTIGEFRRPIIASVHADRLTVAHVLAFADKLREMEVPLTEEVTDNHAHDTHRLIGLLVQYSEVLPGDPE